MCKYLKTFMTIDHNTLQEKNAAVDVNIILRKDSLRGYGLKICFNWNIWSWETILAWTVFQMSEDWCPFANCGKRCSWYPLSSLLTWMDLTFLWIYWGHFRRPSQQVDTDKSAEPFTLSFLVFFRHNFGPLSHGTRPRPCRFFKLLGIGYRWKSYS